MTVQQLLGAIDCGNGMRKVDANSPFYSPPTTAMPCVSMPVCTRPQYSGAEFGISKRLGYTSGYSMNGSRESEMAVGDIVGAREVIAQEGKEHLRLLSRQRAPVDCQVLRRTFRKPRKNRIASRTAA